MLILDQIGDTIRKEGNSAMKEEILSNMKTLIKSISLLHAKNIWKAWSFY